MWSFIVLVSAKIQEFQIQCEEQQMVLRLSLNVGSIEAEFLSYSHGMHKIGVEDCNSRVARATLRKKFPGLNFWSQIEIFGNFRRLKNDI